MGKTKVERSCPICGATFLVEPSRLKHGRGQTCSRACQYVTVAKKNSNPRGQDESIRISLECAGCGATFQMTRAMYASRTKQKGTPPRFCSRKCANGDNEVRAKIVAKLKANPRPVTETQRTVYASKEWRERASRTTLAAWADPEKRARLMSGIRRRSESPEWQSAPHFQRGEDHPRYRGSKTVRRESISRYEYKAWRAAVFRRDAYACTKCGTQGGTLNAHHIKPWADYPELRFDVANGTTLCESCHESEHGLTRRPKTYTCVICGRPKPSGRQPRCRSCGAKTRGML